MRVRPLPKIGRLAFSPFSFLIFKLGRDPVDHTGVLVAQLADVAQFRSIDEIRAEVRLAGFRASCFHIAAFIHTDMTSHSRITGIRL